MYYTSKGEWVSRAMLAGEGIGAGELLRAGREMGFTPVLAEKMGAVAVGQEPDFLSRQTELARVIPIRPGFGQALETENGQSVA